MSIIYDNGKFIALEDATISPATAGFQFGYGLFETVLFNNNRALYLEEHLSRLRSSCHQLDIRFPVALDWQNLINELINMNSFSGPCRAKIIVAVNETTNSDSHVIMSASPYSFLDPDEYATGWSLTIDSERITTTLSKHKSLNYLANILVKKTAHKKGFNDGILCDKNGELAETSIANLMFEKDGKFFIPATEFRLQGITEAVVRRWLRTRDKDVIRIDVKFATLRQFSAAYVLNSLIGVMPVARIDDFKFKCVNEALAQQLNKQLFGRE